MKKLVPALRFISLSRLLTLILLFDCSAAVIYGRDWTEQRCEEIQKRLTLLEGKAEQKASEEKVRSAPQIRKEIAQMEEELASLQSFQKASEAGQFSLIINHVPLVTVAMIVRFPGLAPLLSDILERRGGDLLSDVNKREIRLRTTELPRLREEQTDVGRQIFLLRDESESLSCVESATGDDAVRRVVGDWEVAETGHIIRIRKEGYGVLLETRDNQFGFKEGDTVLSEFRVKGDLIEADLAIRASKDDCPTLAPVAARATINVQPGGRTFTLTAPSYAYCTQPCQWSDEQSGTLTRTFKRVAD